jgi:hypothetical protein
LKISYVPTDQESNKKRGRREHRNRYSPNQVSNPSRRGDISVIHGDCDGENFFVFPLTRFSLNFPNRKLAGKNERSYRTRQEVGERHLQSAR